MSISERQQLEIGCTISLTLYTFCLLRNALPFLKSAWAARNTVVERWRKWRNRISDPSSLDEHVSREVEGRLVESLRKVITAVAHCLTAFLCSVMINVVNEIPHRLSEIQVWLLIGFTSCLTIARMIPTLLNRHTVHIWYATFLIAFSICIASNTTISAERAWNHSNLLLPLRMLLSIYYSNLPVVIAFNCVYSSAATYAVANALSFQDPLMVDADVRLRGVIFFEVAWLFLIVYLSNAFTASLRREIVYQSQATCLRGESSAMMHLLDVMCDVVTELDRNKRIAENSKRLAAMFALNPANGTKGSQLQDLMPHAEDRNTVDELLQSMSSNAENTNPRLAHVTLSDSYGMHFRADLFFVHFSGLDLSSRFYVGIQESRDVRVAELPEGRNSQSRNGPGVTQTEGDSVSLGSNASDGASVDGSPNEPLLHPHFRRTKKDSEVLSLMMAMVTWNFIVPPRKCCAYHAALDEMLRIAKPLTEGPCNSAFRPDFSAQCSHCGILDEWDNVRDSLECPHCRQGRMTRGSRVSSL